MIERRDNTTRKTARQRDDDELRLRSADWTRAPWDGPADMCESSGFFGVVSSELTAPGETGPAPWLQGAPHTDDDPETRVVTRIGRAVGPRDP